MENHPDYSSKTTYIYALFDPLSGRLRYIGKSNRPEERLKEHLQMSVHKKTHLGYWLKGLKDNGAKPILIIVERCQYCEWQERERAWILAARDGGCNLVNATSGGEGVTGAKISEKRREQIRLQMRGNQYRKGITHTQETRKKISVANTGKKHSEEWKRNIGLGHKGKKPPPVTEETRRRMSEAQKKRPKKRCRETPTWNSYRAMKDRCCNPNNKNYSKYKERGIRVCQRWLDTFDNFLDDMGEKPSGTILGRINPDRGFVPENCLWMTPAEERKSRRDVQTYSFRGNNRTVDEIAREVGMFPRTLRRRIYSGMGLDDAISKPVTAQKWRNA